MPSQEGIFKPSGDGGGFSPPPVRPMPQVLDGKKWKVVDSGNPRIANVDKSKRVLTVPMGDTEREHMTQVHELAHIKISPKDFSGIPEDVPIKSVQAIEDARVYSFLKYQAGFDTDSVCLWEDSEYAAFANCPSLLDQARALAATRNTGDYQVLKSVCDPELVVRVEKLFEPWSEKERRGELPTFADTLSLAESLAEALEEQEQQQPDDGDGEGEGEALQGRGEASKRPEEGSREETRQAPERGEDDGGESPKRTPGKSPSEQAKKEAEQERGSGSARSNPLQPFRFGFGGSNKEERYERPEVKLTPEERKTLEEMGIPDRDHYGYHYGYSRPAGTIPKVETPPLTERLPRKKSLGVRRISTDSGDNPRDMHRYAVDKAVFRRPKKKVGTATVLIDVSGSMHITEEQIADIIRAVPTARVAIYSGHARTGRLAIVADKGKWVSSIGRLAFPGSNIVDVPALEWLAKQPGPRYWISDGICTGWHDSPLDTPSQKRLARVCATAKITRVYPFDKLAETGLLKKEEIADSALAY